MIESFSKTLFLHKHNNRTFTVQPKTNIVISLEMDSLSEQTLAGLTEKEVKQLAKRCPIVMTVTEDVLVERFEYTEGLQSNRPGVLEELKLDLKDAQVNYFLKHLFENPFLREKFYYSKTSFLGRTRRAKREGSLGTSKIPSKESLGCESESSKITTR